MDVSLLEALEALAISRSSYSDCNHRDQGHDNGGRGFGRNGLSSHHLDSKYGGALESPYRRKSRRIDRRIRITTITDNDGKSDLCSPYQYASSSEGVS